MKNKIEQSHETFQVKIEKIVSGGHGFSLLDGQVVFTDYSLPGELVEVMLVKSKKGYSWGRLQKILEPSPLRIEPKCQYFGTCGGCQFQMIDYKNQMEIKKGIIAESMTRIGKISVPVNDIIESDNAFYYRNKGSFQVFGSNEIGYCKPGRNVPFAITSCPIMEHPINDKIKEFLETPAERVKLKGMKALVIRSNQDGKTINSTIKRDKFTDSTSGLNFIVDVDTFFQVNRNIIPKWLSYIKKLILQHKVGKGLLDLYCGVGIIAQYLAPHFDHVVGIEVNKRLVENGNAVLKENKITNAQFIEADASRFYDYGFDYDTVIINPPRTGIDKNMVKTLTEVKPEVIIYSSCNPDTFARDVQMLSEGGYGIDEIQPFDMFPQTQHCEVVGVLYLKK